MSRTALMSTSLMVPLALLMAWSAVARAQAASPVFLDCGTSSNACSVWVNSPNSPTPLRYTWSFNTQGTDAIFKRDCTNQSSCEFWCPSHEGTLQAGVQVRDANNQLIGTSSAQAVCTQQGIILP